MLKAWRKKAQFFVPGKCFPVGPIERKTFPSLHRLHIGLHGFTRKFGKPNGGFPEPHGGATLMGLGFLPDFGPA